MGARVVIVVILALAGFPVVIIVAWRYLSGVPEPHKTAAFIEPSQSVRW